MTKARRRVLILLFLFVMVTGCCVIRCSDILTEPFDRHTMLLALHESSIGDHEKLRYLMADSLRENVSDAQLSAYFSFVARIYPGIQEASFPAHVRFTNRPLPGRVIIVAFPVDPFTPTLHIFYNSMGIRDIGFSHADLAFDMLSKTRVDGLSRRRPNESSDQ